jgi:hypothetical protein
LTLGANCCWCCCCLQDKYHLYFLFDLMPGGDLMDVLVAEAKVIRQRVPSAAWQVACLAPKVCLTAQVCGVHALVCLRMLPGTPCLQVSMFSGWRVCSKV